MLLVCYHFKIEQFLKGYIFIILIINILYLKHIINFPIHSFLLFSYNFITKKNPHIYIEQYSFILYLYYKFLTQRTYNKFLYSSNHIL